jgi:methionine-rich copper-binding protein CopC
MAWRGGWLSLLVLSSVLLVPATPARAHAKIVLATPPPGAILATAPARVDLLFDEELEHEDSRITVHDLTGARVDRGDLQVMEKRMTIGVRDLPPGQYSVRWIAVSEHDGHKTRESYRFSVGLLSSGQPQLLVTPDRSDAGQLMTVRGSGFTPNALTLVTIGDDQQDLAALSADGQGQFALQTTIPENLPHGRQVIQALDVEQRMATAALRIERGGWPPIAVQVSAGAEHAHGPDAAAHANHVAIEIRLVNRSGWHLRGLDVRATIPSGTRVLLEDLEGPEGVPWEIVDGTIRWRGARVDAHQILGPFTFVVDTAALPPGAARPAPNVSVSFQHTTPPLFRGVAVGSATP